MDLSKRMMKQTNEMAMSGDVESLPLCVHIWADEVEQLEIEKRQREAIITLIGDIAYDRDGYTGDAKKLGELIDEIYHIARG